MPTASQITLIENFDRLPNAALVAPKVAALVLGVSERTLRRHPATPQIRFSARRVAYRVGDLRRFGCGEGAAAPVNIPL
jgi:hypothetical protein